jgi:DNA-directed RNA polymerase subunit delta
MNFREMTKEQLMEESLINLAYAILNEKRASVSFNDLLTNIQELVGYSDEEMKARLLQFYTDLNIEGRFLFNQETGWGLREWYKVEQIEEETAPSVKTHKKKSKAALEDEDDLDEELEEEDIDFDEDYEEFVEDEDDIDEEEEDKEDIDFDEEDIEDIDEEIDEDFIDEDEDELEEEDEA